jgi:hypothetical protein
MKFDLILKRSSFNNARTLQALPRTRSLGTGSMRGTFHETLQVQNLDKWRFLAHLICFLFPLTSASRGEKSHPEVLMLPPRERHHHLLTSRSTFRTTNHSPVSHLSWSKCCKNRGYRTLDRLWKSYQREVVWLAERLNFFSAEERDVTYRRFRMWWK